MERGSTNLTKVVATVCAVGLVVASAGFAATYAYRIGVEHSYLLAGLTIVFAVALEGVKPLAIHSAFQAFSNLSLFKGLALSALGLVAVAYSLTSELALMAGSRGDVAAKRQTTLDYKAELDRIGPTRELGELRALVAGVLSDSRVNGCTVQDGPVSRSKCQQMTEWQGEIARAERKLVLSGLIERSSGSTSVKVADPGASALAVYLAALGITASVEMIGTWLHLVPVLGLELGSALAMVLVQAVSGTREPPMLTVRPLQTPLATKLIETVKNNGGRLNHSERQLAKVLSADRNAVRRTLLGLAAMGTIALAVSKQGTEISLV